MSENFSRQLLSGTFYIGIAKYSGLVISIIVIAVLSRILTPAEFGIVAIATVFINFFSILTTVGFSPAIIQNKELTTIDISHIYSFTVYLALVAGVIFAVISPLIAFFYETKVLINICLLLSVNIVFCILNIVPNALTLRDKKFKFISIRTFFIHLLMGIAAIFAALNGAGIYSLLINPVIGSVLIYFVTIKKMPVKFQLRIQWDSVGKVMVYSIFQILFNFVYLLYRNIDKLLLGKYMGMVILGYYEKSYRLMMLPLENVSAVISPVLHPVLSDYQKEPGVMYQKYKKLVSLLAYFGFPLSVFCFFSAKELILIIFGTQWLMSVPVFKILSLSVGIQIAQAPIGAMFQSMNDTKGLFIASLGALICIVAGIIGGFCMNDINYIAVFLVIGFYMAFILYNVILMKRWYPDNYSDFFRILLKPILLTLLFAAILKGAAYLTGDFNMYGLLGVNLLLLLIFYGLLMRQHKQLLYSLKRK